MRQHVVRKPTRPTAAAIRLPEFARLEHSNEVDPLSLPPYSASVAPKEALDVALEVFSKTELGLQDAVILASAVAMGTDALCHLAPTKTSGVPSMQGPNCLFGSLRANR